MADVVRRERRAEPRTTPAAQTSATRARLRPGRSALIVNLSAAGALIETEWRLLPGTRVELQIGDAEPAVRIGARVLRCQVSSLSRERVRYRGAVAFENLIPKREVATHRIRSEQ